MTLRGDTLQRPHPTPYNGPMVSFMRGSASAERTRGPEPADTACTRRVAGTTLRAKQTTRVSRHHHCSPWVERPVRLVDGRTVSGCAPASSTSRARKRAVRQPDKAGEFEKHRGLGQVARVLASPRARPAAYSSAFTPGPELALGHGDASAAVTPTPPNPLLAVEPRGTVEVWQRSNEHQGKRGRA